MSKIQYTPVEYRIMLKMSPDKYLLVEGKDDKRLFQYLLSELFNRFSQSVSHKSINIDSAEHLIQTRGGLSNREKVEQVCSSVQESPLANKLIGFVDREFRDFEINEALRDDLNKHKLTEGVVWSRGHSIENYCFEFLTLRDPLREHSDIDHFDQALDRFNKIFDSTLRLACAVSLAAKELGKLQQIKGCIDWKIIEITSLEVKLRLDIFRQELVTRHKFTEEEYNTLMEYFHKWLEKAETTDLACVRWMCHGHIGFRFLWATYGQCVHEFYKQARFDYPEAEVCKVLEAKENIRFRACINSWVKRALDNLSEYPIEVLKFFDLSIPGIEEITSKSDILNINVPPTHG